MTSATTWSCCGVWPASRSGRAHYVCVLVALRAADDPEPLIVDARWYGEIRAGSAWLMVDSVMTRCSMSLSLGSPRPNSIPSKKTESAIAALRWLRWRPDWLNGGGELDDRDQAGAPADAGGGCRVVSAPGTLNAACSAAALALRSLPVVRSQVPVLRFQFARSGDSQKSVESEYIDCAAGGSRSGVTAHLGSAHRQHFHWWRHAEPDERRGPRSSALGHSCARCRLRRTAKSRLKPIRARSRPSASPPIARPAVNRLSIGIQSFDEEKLKALGRIHDRAQALAAIEVAQRHFDNFNLDLMYALPRQVARVNCRLTLNTRSPRARRICRCIN